MSIALALEDVHVRVGATPVLAGVSLRLAVGETLALLGPSGSGKTTLVRLALGLTAPDAGSVRVDGREASRAGRIVIPPEARGLGVVFQDLALWPHLTVVGNLGFGLRARGVPRREVEPRVDALLERVGLAGKGRRYPGNLSGGERQRVAIARALVVEPHVLLFDEPLANLDIALKSELLGLFQELLRERNIAALYVTHDPREASRMTSRWAVLENGAITQEGDLTALRSGPATPFVRALVEDLSATPC